GVFQNFDKGEDTDVWALEHNYASVVPVQFDLTAHHAIPILNGWSFNNHEDVKADRSANKISAPDGLNLG
ncbi:MAG: 5'/3'-nucleotidase SurE, partial [Chitinophagaceae bacterium]